MFLSAFILGLAGSLHCAGMCSPLVFAVTGMKKSAWLNRVVYNSGRIFTYGILGALVSTLGVALPLEKFQTVLSISMGLILISVGLLGTNRFKIPYLSGLINQLTIFLKMRFSVLIQRKNIFSTFLLGTLNGLLPCGLTFIALTTCLILPGMWDGFYFMLIFGAGTLPIMLGFVSLVQLSATKLKFSFQRVNTIMLIVAGSLLIGRVMMEPHAVALSTEQHEIEICR